MTGTIIAHYRVGGLLGSGGMGSVYVADDLQLGREVALKVLPPELASDPERLERFRREARAIAALNHPNIVTVYSVEEVEGRHLITMERVRGQTIDRLLTDKGLPLREVLALGIQIAEALVSAHGQGVVHRDLKPTNVMVDPDGRVKVIDFGLAKLLLPTPAAVDPEAPTAAQTVEGRILGTPAYMSPEQLSGQQLDHRSDLFSFGILLFELCTGRRPFTGNSAMEIISSILKDAPTAVETLRPDLPPELDRMLRHCLEKDTRQRVQSARDLLYELKDLQNRLVTGKLELKARPTPNRTVVFGAVGVAAALVVVGGLLWWRARTPAETRRPAAAGVDKDSGPVPVASYRFIPPEPWSSESAAEEWPAFSPDGTRLVYSMTVDGFKKLFVRDLARTQPPEQLTTGPTDDIQPAWSPDGQSIAFVRADSASGKLMPGDVYGGFYREGGELFILDLKSRKARQLAPDAYRPSFNRDGLLAFCAGLNNNMRIWTCDILGRGLRPVTEGADKEDHLEPTWSPDGRRLAFCLQVNKLTARIAVLDLQTRAITNLTADTYLSGPAWSPSGKAIVFTAVLGSGSGFNLWKLPMNLNGTAAGPLEPLTAGGGRDLNAAFSPDGKLLAYSVIGWNSDVMCVPIDPEAGKLRGEPKVLLASSREDTRAVLSPDEKWVAFTSDREGEMNLWVADFNAATSTAGIPWKVTSGPGGDYQVQWVTPGDRLVFFSRRSGNDDIWLVRLDERKRSASPAIPLTTHPDRDVNPFVSPDGQHIAWQSDRSGANELWVMKADGSEQRCLSQLRGGGHFNPWLDNQSVVWARKRVFLDGREPEPFMGMGGAHNSFSPGHRFILENDHTSLYLGAVSTNTKWASLAKVFQFGDADVGIDYSTWSPSGNWVLLDRTTPAGGDLFLLRNVE